MRVSLLPPTSQRSQPMLAPNPRRSSGVGSRPASTAAGAPPTATTGVAPRTVATATPSKDREAQVQSLRFLKGDWDCFNEADLEGSPIAISRVREHPGGWIKTVTKVTTGNRNGTFCSCMTFDASKNKFVESNYLDNGDYGTSESIGWEGDTLVLKGRRNSQVGAHDAYQKAYTKIDDNTFQVVAHSRKDGGELKLENRGICRRNPGLPPDESWGN